MKIKDIMDKNISTFTEDMSLRDASQVFFDQKISDLMIVDKAGNFIGVVSQGDLIRRVLPDLEELKHVSNGMLAKAYQIFIESGKFIQSETIETLVIRNPIKLHPEDELLKSAIVMTELQIQSLPVVVKNELVGIVTRSQICLAILS